MHNVMMVFVPVLRGGFQIMINVMVGSTASTKCIRVLATEISVTSARTHGHDEKAQLNSGWISIGSELYTLNFNSSVRAEQSLAICYPNIVSKCLCGNLNICLNYYANAHFWSRNSVRVLSAADRDRT